MTGRPDCLRNGNTAYQALVGKAVSLDPQFMGLTGTPVALSNTDSTTSHLTAANNSSFVICSMTIRSQRKLDATTWEYIFDASIGNSGAAVAGVTARLTLAPYNAQIVQPDLEFGALQQGDVADVGNQFGVRRGLRQHEVLHREFGIHHAAGAVLEVEGAGLDRPRCAHLLAHGDDFGTQR